MATTVANLDNTISDLQEEIRVSINPVIQENLTLKAENVSIKNELCEVKGMLADIQTIGLTEIKSLIMDCQNQTNNKFKHNKTSVIRVFSYVNEIAWLFTLKVTLRTMNNVLVVRYIQYPKM